MKTKYLIATCLFALVLLVNFSACADDFKIPVIEEYADVKEPEPEPQEPEEPQEPSPEDIVPPVSKDPQYPRFYTQENIEYVAGQINKQEEPWKGAYEKLIEIANSYQNREHQAVEDYHTSAFHDNPEDNIEAREGLTLDSYAAYSNALAYALTGEEKYGNKAIYFLNAWAATNKSITENDSEGNATGTSVGAANLISEMMIAADLLLGHDIWSEEDKTAFINWVRYTALPIFRSIYTKANNWGDWGTFATAMTYHILGLNNMVKDQADRVATRLSKSVSADGSMPQEVRREGNGLWYTYYALTPITMSAQLLYNTVEVDIFSWSSGEKSLKKALDYLHYYELNRMEWPHWTFTTNKERTKDAPTDLFEAMNDYYNDEYKEFTTGFQPVLGGYKGNRISHFGWNFATLMRMPNKTMSKSPGL